MPAVTTLMGREETDGRRYPLWLERIFLLAALGVFIVYAPSVHAAVEQPILATFLAYVVYPLVLLAIVELLGRVVQSLHASKL